MSRPFDVRVREYRDSLQSQADQLEEIGRRSGRGDQIEDTVALFRVIAVDLTKLLDGEELKGFVITGEMPVAPAPYPRRPRLADGIGETP